ncbi:Lrp/AsnC family transcriptional regulator [Candidatus Woesearchaeota archaeon]|nr:Lrp/AsnC family transcriptional regulator [Candidatus Woesearchaeota archaeon]
MPIELDLLDKKILYELDLDSRQHISTLAKAVKASKETVNFRIKRLSKERYIKKFITTINISNLNSYYYKLFYKFYQATPEVEQKIIQFIEEYPKTAWLGTFEGPYDLAFLILAKSIYDLDEFLVKFRKLFGIYILEQEIHVITSVHRFNAKFFHSSTKTLHTHYPKTLKESKIDELDHNLMKELANNSRSPILTLAHRFKVDSGTIIYHIKKLKKEGILGTSTLALNFERFGLQHFQVNFKLKDYDSVKKIIAFFSQHAKATFATTTLGRYDLAIELVVKNNQELKSIFDSIKKLYSTDIIDYDTFLITKEFNVTWYPNDNR